ncbi:MAG: ABC transporter substrate-binding protein [Acidobacteriota bacterium]|nr:ABC transporter substrate-binding protein [Acidobacteriota bacterium]
MGSRVWSLAAALVVFPAVVSLAHAQTIQPQPYASIATDGETYAGPGRSPANDLTGPDLRIGLLAPLRGPRKPEGDAMVAAAGMALRDAAPHGLIHGRRLSLAVEDESGPSWGMVSDAVIRLALQDDTIAMITSTSGADAHLAEQAGNRIGLPVLTLSADATTTQIDIPWIFRMRASDVAESQLLARDIYSVRGLKKVLLITQQGHDGHRGIDAMREAASDLSGPAPSVVELDSIHPDLASAMQSIETESPQAVVIWTSPEMAASLVHALRTAGVTSLLYLSQDASSGLHENAAGNSTRSEAWTIAVDGEAATARRSFAKRLSQVTGKPSSTVASETYDAVTMTLRALQVAGPNRARVRDELARVHGHDGASGTISFDKQGNDRVALHLVKIE